MENEYWMPLFVSVLLLLAFTALIGGPLMAAITFDVRWLWMTLAGLIFLA